MSFAAAIIALLPVATAAHGSWLDEPAVQRQLEAGNVVFHATPDARQSATSANAGYRVDVAIRVNADRETIWGVLRDCEHAASFIPGLKRCHTTRSAPDGSWDIIEHEMKYSWLLPTIHSVFRADYQRPTRIDFHRIGGDMKDERGAWLLESTPDAAATIVEYQLYVEPGFWVPGPLMRHWVNKELPAALTALRARVEGESVRPVAVR